MANPVRQLFVSREPAARVILCDLNGNPYKASGGGGGTTVTTYNNSIAQGDLESVITHNLGDANAILLSAFANWNSGQPYITDQDADTITVKFPNACPFSSGGELVGGVIPS